jgi:Tol biopolymer transport system component
VRLAPDGTRVAAQIFDGQHQIWLWDFGRDSSWRRLTFDHPNTYGPVWTRDGRHIIYGSPRDTKLDIGNLYRRAASGSGNEDRLTTSDRQQRVNTITPDGTRLIFEVQTPDRDAAADAVRRARRGDFAGRPLDGVRLERVRPAAGVRAALPERGRRAVPDLD